MVVKLFYPFAVFKNLQKFAPEVASCSSKEQPKFVPPILCYLPYVHCILCNVTLGFFNPSSILTVLSLQSHYWFMFILQIGAFAASFCTINIMMSSDKCDISSQIRVKSDWLTNLHIGPNIDCEDVGEIHTNNQILCCKTREKVTKPFEWRPQAFWFRISSHQP